MGYDIKYRRRALDYWGEGNSKRKTAEVFKVSASTLQEWKSQLKETGTLTAKRRKETWRKIEPAKLRKYIEENPDAYLREIAAEFNCTSRAVEKALARLKITRKKNGSIS
jgi:transposase